MGKTLGLSTYPKQRNPVFLQTQQLFSSGREYSDETAAKLDEEVKSILEQREQQVSALLITHKETLIKVSEMLLEKEVLFEEDFQNLLNVKSAGNLSNGNFNGEHSPGNS